ncbi:MAG: radical SAM protein [Dehalococcoidia bacterium]|nr:radical SAM protein [Dehalococcoidia bacterium]
MRVALFTLPNPFLSTPTAHFPTGLLYVAKALHKAGHELQLVDLRASTGVYDYHIPDCDVVAVTATSAEAHWAKQVSALARARGLETMIGGAHATFMTEDCQPDFDYVVRGDGELAAINALADGRRGVYEIPLPRLDDVFPLWSLAGEAAFSRELFSGAGYGQGPKSAGLMMSRGCPYCCRFCRSEHVAVRLRPVEDIVTEISHLQRVYGVHHYRFYDDCMTLNPARFREICLLFKGLGIHWRAHTRSNLWTAEMAAWAKEGGCTEMGFGFESADDRVLQAVHKQETVEQNRAAVQACRQAGIISKAFWLTGMPGETWDSVQAIKDFMDEERPDRWIVSALAPYPGSDLWEHPEAYGIKWIERDLSKYNNFSDDPLLEYENCNRVEVAAHYRGLKAWLEENYPHERS